MRPYLFDPISLKLPEGIHVGRLDIEPVIERLNTNKHQNKESDDAHHEINHQALFLVQPFGILGSAVFLKGDIKIVTNETGHQREEKDQFQSIANDEYAEKQGEASGVKKHANKQLLLIIVLKRASIGPGRLGVANVAILGQPLAVRAEAPASPVDTKHREMVTIAGRS